MYKWFTVCFRGEEESTARKLTMTLNEWQQNGTTVYMISQVPGKYNDIFTTVIGYRYEAVASLGSSGN